MKTAMQELEEKLKDNLKRIVLNADYELMEKLFKQGFEKEKEQIIQAYKSSINTILLLPSGIKSAKGNAENYYNRTYNN